MTEQFWQALLTAITMLTLIIVYIFYGLRHTSIDLGEIR